MKQSRLLVYILHSGNLYGTERAALGTLSALPEYESRIVLAPPGRHSGSVVAAAQQAGYEGSVFEGRLDLASQLLRLFLRHRRVDVITTSITQSAICISLSFLTRVKLCHLHVVHGGSDDHDSYGRKHLLNRSAVKFVAVSDFTRQQLVGHRVAPEKIAVIGNFLTAEDVAQRPKRVRFEGREPLISSSRPLKVAVISRLDPLKRVDVLLDAVEGGRLDAFHFDVYGDGPMLEAFRQRATKLPNVVFHGYAVDAATRLAEADFFVHLCPVETFGLVILEAFAACLPVVAPDAGGAGELVDDGVNGFCYKAGDAMDLAAVLLRAATLTPEQLNAIVGAASAALATTYSGAAGADRYRALLMSAD
jgi:glycosyltransferase involved in cell wall biosynthesis